MSIVEIWKDIVGFENLYKVSNLGNVKRCSSGRILKQLNGMDGYKQVSLCKNGVPKTYLIHRKGVDKTTPFSFPTISKSE